MSTQAAQVHCVTTVVQGICLSICLSIVTYFSTQHCHFVTNVLAVAFIKAVFNIKSFYCFGDKNTYTYLSPQRKSLQLLLYTIYCIFWIRTNYICVTKISWIFSKCIEKQRNVSYLKLTRQLNFPALNMHHNSRSDSVNRSLSTPCN